MRPSAFIPPSLPVVRDEPPVGPYWQHEAKLDGYRIQLHKHANGVSLYSRNGTSYTSRYPTIVNALALLPARSAILDGELVAFTREGHIDFRTLHSRDSRSWLAVFVFDLLEINGVDLRPL